MTIRFSPPRAARVIRSSLTGRTNVYRSLCSARAQIFAGVASAFVCYLILLRGIASSSTTRTTPPTQNSPPSSAPRTSKISETKYDCSISWLRLPKTASTSIFNAFISPLTSDEKLFQNTELGPNVYMTHVGGCEDRWREVHAGWKRPRRIRRNPLGAPPFGVAIDHAAYSRNVSNKRFFKSAKNKERIVCFEYDERNKTINFGPEGNRASRPSIPASRKIRYASSPNMQTHVGLDVSLFGWVLPEQPLVFSAFREPVERLLSSSHFGLHFGGGIPGEYLRCKSKVRRTDWQKRITNAVKQFTFENNSTEYQNLLRGYFNNCRRAVHNIYVQFLDPGGKNLKTALHNLERYVIPGLQTNIEETLSKWVNITLHSCRDHSKFKEMKRRMNATLNLDFESDTSESKKKYHARTSETTIKGAHPGTEEKELIYPKFDQLDPDLQSLVRELTAMDEVIYERAKEMFQQWN